MRHVALLGVLLAAGCGSEPTAAPPAPATAALTVEEALAHEGAGELVLVRGLLLVDRDGPRLCAALAESYPPQCGRPSLVVEGLPQGREGLREAEGVAWSERAITLRGRVESAQPHVHVRADAVLRVGG